MSNTNENMLTEAEIVALLDEIAALNGETGETGCEQLAIVTTLVERAPRPLPAALLDRAEALARDFQYGDWSAAALADLASLAEPGSDRQRDLCRAAVETLAALSGYEIVNPLRHILTFAPTSALRLEYLARAREIAGAITEDAIRAEALALLAPPSLFVCPGCVSGLVLDESLDDGDGLTARVDHPIDPATGAICWMYTPAGEASAELPEDVRHAVESVLINGFKPHTDAEAVRCQACRAEVPGLTQNEAGTHIVPRAQA